VNVDRALEFLDFVRERHYAWEAKQHDKCQPWSNDDIVNTRKFTNVFRLLDFGSQFVITDLVGPGAGDYLMRCFLYRHTNRVEAWKAYAAETGGYPLIEDLDDLREFWHEYKAGGGQVFSGAYMIYPQSSTPGTDKIDSIIDLTIRLFREDRIYNEFMLTGSQREKFGVLRRNKGVADFMSMQILTDFGYDTEFREDEFVVPGPGARKGAYHLEMNGEGAIEWASEAIQGMDDPPLIWGSGNRGHFLSRMDVQNCLCEFSKYVRYQSKPSPQKFYSPAHPGVQSKPVLPRHWHN
jgi:hypothetical protein